MRRISTVLMAAVAALGMSGLASAAVENGKPAPDFTLTAHDGKTYKLSDLKEKIVVLEWFDEKCPFVVKHYAKDTTMRDLAKKYGEHGVVWLAINSSHYATQEYLAESAKKWKIQYPILNDASGEVGRLYGARTTPHMFIINKGTLVYQGGIDDNPTGRVANEETVNYVAKAMDQFLAGETITEPQTRPYGCTVKYKQK